MFDGFDNDNQKLHCTHLLLSPVPDEVDEDLRHWVTLIGTSDYSLEVQMSGYVSVEREMWEAEAFLANLYEHG